MEPFPGKLLEMGEEEGMGSGNLGEQGEAALGGTKGTKPQFLWLFSPERQLWSPRDSDGHRGDGDRGSGGSVLPQQAVGDRGSGAVGQGQSSQNKPPCAQRSVLRTGTARAGAESREQLRKHINAP